MKAIKLTLPLIFIILLLPVVAHAESIELKMLAGVKDIGANEETEIPSFLTERSEMEGQKSRWKALGLSLLLPGAGQYYNGDRGKMAIFGGLETLVWSGFFGFRIYGGWKKEDYKGWAAFHAGINVNDKPESYFEKMTFYDNLDVYNQFERFKGSQAEIFPSTPEYYWNWDSDQSRQIYRDLRNDSKSAYRRSLLFLGGVVINRVLSGIDAFRSTHRHDREQEFNNTGVKIHYSAANLSGDGEIEIGLSLHF